MSNVSGFYLNVSNWVKLSILLCKKDQICLMSHLFSWCSDEALMDLISNGLSGFTQTCGVHAASIYVNVIKIQGFTQAVVGNIIGDENCCIKLEASAE